MEHVHQPGLAAPDWAPQVNAAKRFASRIAMQRLMAALQPLDRAQLGVVTDVTLTCDSLLIQGKRSAGFHNKAIVNKGDDGNADSPDEQNERTARRPWCECH